MKKVNTQTYSKLQLESWQVYNNFQHRILSDLLESGKAEACFCVRCQDVIPACDQHHSGLCVGCWLLDHPLG